MRGYTRFTREHGDAAAARLAQTFAGLARDSVEARGGRVIELRGDEALAVFSSPAAAVRAATELVAVCAEETTPDLPLLVGVGIDVGEAVPVEGGFRGAALNMAARLCSKAEGGQVLVTSALAERARDARGLRYASVGLAELKGLEAPVELIEAVPGERSPPLGPHTPSARAEALPTELETDTLFVGREHELSWLRGTWRQARRGEGRIVFVSGAPQSGKTRLAAQLADFVADQGVSVAYVGPGGASAAVARAATGDATTMSRPSVLILDDFEALGEPVAARLDELWEAVEAAPVLVVGIVRKPEALPALALLVERADRNGDGHRALGPLNSAEISELARVYAGAAVDEVPLESIERASGGLPGRVHELMSVWAEQEASRRLAAAAEWLASERTSRKADLEFANNVIGLKLARLYAPEEADRDTREAVCPYKGLASFEESDARLFFGRESLVGELAARTVGSGLLAVVGPSGSGKSSLIAAGLLPSLGAGLLPGSERWRLAVIRPGEHPMSELQAVGAPDGEARLVLVVDQFEEVFTTCQDEQERAEFVDSLTALAVAHPEPSIAVLSLRGDFIDHCAAYPRLAELISANQVLVGPMTQEELRRTIELPARRVGLRVEAALVDSLVDEVAGEPGGLPLLSAALVELWQNRSDSWLRLATHERTGGVHGAVSRLAEATYAQLSESEGPYARSMFLRLVATGEGEDVTSRRAPLAEFDLESDPVAASVLSRLTQDRLLTRSDGMVEVAHEALLREWPRLQEWLHEDAQGRELRQHLAHASRQWEERGRDNADLYRGARLSATLDWASTHDRELNRLERDFVVASRRASERAVRRLRTGVAVLTALLVVAVGAGIFAFHQSRVSKHQARVATGRALTEASAANLDIDSERSVLLALKAVDTFRSTSGSVPRETVEALHRAIEASRVLVTVHTPASKYVAFGPNGRLMATGGTATLAGQGGAAFLWDTQTGRRILAFPAQKGQVGPDLRFSPDGSQVFTHVAGRGILAWSTRTGKQLVFLPDPGPINNLALSPDEKHLASTSLDGKLGIWDIAKRRRLTTITNPTPLCGVSFSPGGTSVAAALCFSNPASAAGVWDARSGRKLLTIGRNEGFGSATFNVAYSPDGRRIVTVGNDYKGRIWDARSGRLLTTLVGHTGWVFGVRFSPDGRRIATGSSDGTARVWDSMTGRQLLVLAGHTKNVYDVDFSPDGARLLTGSADGSARIWDLRPEGNRDALTLPAQGGFRGALAVSYSPSGKQLVTGGGGRPSASLWGSSTGRRLRSLPYVGDVYSTNFSPDGRRILITGNGIPIVVDAESGRVLLRLRKPGGPIQPGAAWSPNGRLIALAIGNNPGEVTVWDARSGRLVRRFPYPPNGVSSVTFSPDASHLAASSFGRTARIWDLGSDRLLTTLSGHGDTFFALTYSADGSRLATIDFDGTATVWDAHTGRPITTMRGTGSGALYGVAFSPDGKLLATAGDDTTVRLWDVSTGKELLTLTGATRSVLTVAFSPDGTRLVAASADGNVRVYILPLDQLMEVARSRLTRTWTPTECQQFLHTKRCPATP